MCSRFIGRRLPSHASTDYSSEISGRRASLSYDSEVPVSAVGLNHHLAPTERLAVVSKVAADVQAELAASSLTGHIVLSTCNRFEIYFDSDSFHAGLETVLASIRGALPFEQRELVDHFEVYAGQAAVQHLLEVACGLDSMVIGEAEVIGQVRDALKDGEAQAGASLRRLFNAALTTAKAVTSRTDLGAAGRSIAQVGLDLISSRHFGLAAARVLIVGTGRYAAVVVAALNRLGCADIEVYSESGRATTFAATHPVRPVPEGDLLASISTAQVLVTCRGGGQADSPLITAELLALARGTDSVLPILDLSLHGDVEAGAGELLNVDLIDLDEIGAHAPAEQTAAIIAARNLVTRGVDTYLHLEQGRAASPAVTAIRAHVSQFIEREIESAARRYDPATAAAVAHSLRRVSNALLHTPSLRAAEFARSGDLADYSQALHTLFGIEVEAKA